MTSRYRAHESVSGVIKALDGIGVYRCDSTMTSTIWLQPMPESAG